MLYQLCLKVLFIFIYSTSLEGYMTYKLGIRQSRDKQLKLKTEPGTKKFVSLQEDIMWDSSQKSNGYVRIKVDDNLEEKWKIVSEHNARFFNDKVISTLESAFDEALAFEGNVCV